MMEVVSIGWIVWKGAILDILLVNIPLHPWLLLEEEMSAKCHQDKPGISDNLLDLDGHGHNIMTSPGFHSAGASIPFWVLNKKMFLQC